MDTLVKTFNWKKSLWTSALLLILLSGLNFYGIYTNTFSFLEPDNYIIPVLSVVHFLYMYVVWFKITEDELPDPKMRNLEYGLYAMVAVYLYKIYDSASILGSVSQFGDHVIPATFKPVGIVTLVSYSLLVLLTLYTFWLRKKHVGAYNFENFNRKLNIWH